MVEIDRNVVDLAEAFFGFQPDRVVVGDAIDFLLAAAQSGEEERHDCVISDMFAGKNADRMFTQGEQSQI